MIVFLLLKDIPATFQWSNNRDHLIILFNRTLLAKTEEVLP